LFPSIARSSCERAVRESCASLWRTFPEETHHGDSIEVVVRQKGTSQDGHRIEGRVW
jgi:hypothetical protein